uniref:Syntaxin 6 n=1 Tax=Zonotrichia albicollis TaxID=44394 RepID=A0A8D2N138_ZONAL
MFGVKLWRPCSAGHGAVTAAGQLGIIWASLHSPGCREVQKAVNTAQGLFQRWTELLQDPSIATREEIDWTTNELRNNLRSIEWDLEDLDETISIVEANPRKFNLDATELGIRKAFITSTRQVVRDMKDQMSNSSMQALAERKNRQALLGESGSQSWSSGPDKYSRLDRELQLANSHFIEEQQAQQQLIVEQQDEQLELVSGSIGVLKNMSQRIGGELEEQAVMLDDFSHELDSTQSRLDNVMKKLAKVSHMTSGRSWGVGCSPGKGETSPGSSGWDIVLPPSQPRGGSSSQFLKEGEGFQARQLLLPRHCSAACPLPLFYLQMPFYLCCCCWENPPLAAGRGSSAASCSAALSRAACGTKAVKVPLNTECLQQSPSQIPPAAGACRLLWVTSLSW